MLKTRGILFLLGFISLDTYSTVIIPNDKPIGDKCTETEWYPAVNYQQKSFQQRAVCSYSVQGRNGTRTVSVQTNNTRIVEVRVFNEVSRVKNALIEENHSGGVAWCRRFNSSSNGIRHGRRSNVYERKVYQYSTGDVLYGKEKLIKTHFSGKCI